MKTTLMIAGLLMIGVAQAAMPSARLSVDSVGQSTVLEQRGDIWMVTSQARTSKALISAKIAEPTAVAKAESEYDSIRDWTLESMHFLKPKAGCSDISVKVVGAISKNLVLCSRVPAHKIFAARFRARLLSLSR